MENNYENFSIPNLELILEKLNNNKIIRNKNKKIILVDKIIKVYNRDCLYAGLENHSGLKKHINIKFISSDENGIISLSLLLDKYKNLIS